MCETKKLPELFGSLVFNEGTMKERLSSASYSAWKKCVTEGTPLDLSTANEIAEAMKQWAVEKGATHFTHWFQPMTGVTAEKHDSFIAPVGGGKIMMEFSGKELIRGEPDASSFPSGGLRATFEARGYTAWDPTSYAFIKDNTLCIPTAFCSYTGSVLDKKTPLLRSVEALNRETLRILRLFGHTDVRRVYATVGPEQEYFLIDRAAYERRPDLKYTGRTLFGARPAKGQEMDDQYFGALKTRISAYMRELDEELWKLGVFARTEHNEAAPAQHELAPVFTNVNVATDHNQLTMEMMKKIADSHHLACLLHEKPFEGVNGSGKHNNWSLVTDTGENLLDPGKTPAENTQFLVFLMAVIAAVDDYADLMRVSVASAGNDHRLGANEAPPAIVSIFLGDELTAVLKSIEDGSDFLKQKQTLMEIGAHVLPHFAKDTTDRNRTSPFAFTGNKFEFRMPGSALSVAGPNVVLNTAVAESLSQIYHALKDIPESERSTAIEDLLKELIRKHKRILFNGNGYTDAWVAEAEKRGLWNLKSLPDALPQFIAEKNIDLFTRHQIFTKEEIHSRYEIILENYSKTIHIESLTMQDMVKKDFTPALFSYVSEVSKEALDKKKLLPSLPASYEEQIIKTLTKASEQIATALSNLSADTLQAEKMEEPLAAARYYHDIILSDMDALRAAVDQAEAIIPGCYLPYPTYDELLFSLR